MISVRLPDLDALDVEALKAIVGSDSGGQRAAALYSLIATAKLNGLDPAFYLRTILAQIPEYPSIESSDCCPGISPPHSRPIPPKSLSHSQ